MFYVKAKTTDSGCSVNDGIVTVELDGENIFTVCGKCGKEFQFDLFAASDMEPFGTAVDCPECCDRSGQ